MRTILIRGLCFILALIPAAFPALALDPSGIALAVVPATQAKGPGGDRALAAAQPVFGGDTISTTAGGQAQILLSDNTKLVVGSDSSVVIDNFVLASAGSAGGAALNFTKGAFRFITGKGRAGAYTLQTPTASIGIRGTEFDIAVGDAGTKVMLFRGAVEVCSRVSGNCETIRRPCSAVIATPEGGISVPRQSAPRAGLIRTSFPLVENQKTLRREFRVFTGCSNSNDGTKKGGGDGGDGSGGGGGNGGNGR